MHDTRFEHIFFVCTNEGQPGQTKRRCALTGGVSLLQRMKAKVAALGLKGRVRVTRSGCLDLCAKGCAVAAFSRDPERKQTWYTHLCADDAERLIEAHCVRNERFAPGGT